MNGKAVSGILLALLLIGTLTWAFNIQLVKASGTIYIRADGSIDPPTAPIERDGGLYTLTGNITSDTDGIVIERNNMTLDGAGYTLQGTGSYPSRGIDLSESSNVTLKNADIKSYYHGVHLSSASFSTISRNNITANFNGIGFFASSNNMITNNSIIANDHRGIHLYNSSDNTVSANNIVDNVGDGIWLDSSLNNKILGNNIADGSCGIRLSSSSNRNRISRNTIAENYLNGIILLESSNDNTITENNVTGNRWGITLQYSSNNNTISGNQMHACKGVGLTLDKSSGNTISGNNITENGVGISLSSSFNNTLLGNDIVGSNRSCGIRVYSSIGNTISGNYIANNNATGGLYLKHSSNNTFSENCITENNWSGVYLSNSSGNLFFHNSFINHTYQVYDFSWDHPESPASLSTWDDGYPSGGNYWSDYEDRYPDAEELDDSSIWDTPYVIDENNQDNYPLMEPWTPTPPIPTTIHELKTEIEELGSEGDIDNQGIATSLLAKLNVAQKLIDNEKIDQAKNILNAFINEVQAQSGKHMTPEAADILIESAEYIISNL